MINSKKKGVFEISMSISDFVDLLKKNLDNYFLEKEECSLFRSQILEVIKQTTTEAIDIEVAKEEE